MEERPPPHSAAPIEPVLDTWTMKTGAGAWTIVMPFDGAEPSSSGYNGWFVEAIEGTLEAFSGLARAHQVVGSLVSDTQAPFFQWSGDEPYERFLSRALDAIRSH